MEERWRKEESMKGRKEGRKVKRNERREEIFCRREEKKKRGKR